RAARLRPVHAAGAGRDDDLPVRAGAAPAAGGAGAAGAGVRRRPAARARSRQRLGRRLSQPQQGERGVLVRRLAHPPVREADLPGPVRRPAALPPGDGPGAAFLVVFEKAPLRPVAFRPVPGRDRLEVNEKLLSDDMLSRVKTDDERLYLLNRLV